VQQAQDQERPKEIKVGLLLPLSGPAAELGQDMLQAAEMALFDVGPNDVVLLPRDTAGTPAGAQPGQDFGPHPRGVVLVIGRERAPGVAQLQQLAGHPGILADHQVGPTQRVQGARRQVTDIADRGRDKMEPRGEFTSLDLTARLVNRRAGCRPIGPRLADAPRGRGRA
jgi:hypothetical protein